MHLKSRGTQYAQKESNIEKPNLTWNEVTRNVIERLLLSGELTYNRKDSRKRYYLQLIPYLWEDGKDQGGVDVVKNQPHLKRSFSKYITELTMFRRIMRSNHKSKTVQLHKMMRGANLIKKIISIIYTMKSWCQRQLTQPMSPSASRAK